MCCSIALLHTFFSNVSNDNRIMYGTTTLRIITFSITKLSIMSLSVIGLFATLSMNDT